MDWGEFHPGAAVIVSNPDRDLGYLQFLEGSVSARKPIVPSHGRYVNITRKDGVQDIVYMFLRELTLIQHFVEDGEWE